MPRNFKLLFFILNACALKAQLPNTELWLFKIETTKEGQRLKEPLNITKRDGYDNQPVFSSDGKKIMYVSVREDKQADIYNYSIKKKKTIRFSNTVLSEYSPAETQDGKFLTAVVVESDSSQTIHYINRLTGIHEKKIEVDSVGYYTFLNTDTLIYYKLTQPHSLHYFVVNTQEDKWLGDSPTRGFKALDRHTLLYGLKDSVKTTFYKYDFLVRKAERYADYPSLNEDINWHPSFGLIKSEGARLLRYDELKKEWVILFDLSLFGLKKITRFNINAKTKYLVVVDNL